MQFFDTGAPVDVGSPYHPAANAYGAYYENWRGCII